MAKRGGRRVARVAHRAFALLLLVALAAAFTPLVTGEAYLFTLMPEQIISLPATITLQYSANVIIDGGTLLLKENGNVVKTYAAANFTGSGKAYALTVDGILPGVYQLAVPKRDAAGANAQLPTDVIEFEYRPSDAGLNIRLRPGTSFTVLKATPAGSSPTGVAIPETGFSSVTPYNASFTTTKPAWCKYSKYTLPNYNPAFLTPFDVTGTPSAPVTLHAVTAFTSSFEPFIVWCGSQSHGEILKQFLLGVETTAPSFTIAIVPGIVGDPANMNVNMTVASDQNVHCVAVGDGMTVDFASRYNLDGDDAGAYLRASWTALTFGERPSTKVVKQFTVTCTNRAGLSSVRTANVTIDLVYPPTLTLASPERYTRLTSPLFGVKATRNGVDLESATCFLNDGAKTPLTSKDRIVYTQQLSGLTDGNYSKDVSCVIAGGEEVRKTILFTVDTKAPPAFTLTAPQFVCGLEKLWANTTISNETEPEPNMAGYNYTLLPVVGTTPLENGVKFTAFMNTTITARLNTTPGKEYKWRVFAFDAAANKGMDVTALTKAIEANDTRCDRVPPRLTVKNTTTLAGTVISVACNDTTPGLPSSGCSPTFTYTLVAENTSASACTYETPGNYAQSITVYRTSGFCYEGLDNNGNVAKGFKLITTTGNAEPANVHCTNTLQDVLLGETGVDCGGECPGCPAGAACVKDADCASRYCNPSTGTCEDVLCTDGARNGYETDVDCGGSMCTGCGLEKACNGNADCASRYCDPHSKTCAEEVFAGACESDADCTGYLETCLDGICQRESRPDDPDDDDEDDESSGPSLLALLLFGLGLLLMGGSGYWLYTLHEEKHRERTEDARQASQPVYESRPQELSSEQRLALLRQRQAQLDAIRQREEAAKQRLATKAGARQGLFDAFETEGDTAVKPKGEAPDGARSASRAEPRAPNADSSDDEFVDIRDVGTGKKEHTQESIAKKEEDVPKRRKKESSAFNELDDLLGGKEGK